MNQMNKMNQKQVVLDYLLREYEEAKEMNNVEMMNRLFKAIVIFDYDKLEVYPDWDEMVAAYICGE